jgi:hypothetical protein
MLTFPRLRCDRQHPCGTCAKRGVTDSCNYATTSFSTLDAQPTVTSTQSSSLHGRISELESLVVTLMKGTSVPSLPAQNVLSNPNPMPFTVTSPEIQTQKELQGEGTSPMDPGTLNLRDSRTSYVQSVHWEAILAKVRGLKEDFVADTKALQGSCLFYGPNRHATRDEILAAVPSRPLVDRLIALHFDSCIVTTCQYFPSWVAALGY